MGARCGWTRPTSPTSPDRPTPSPSTASARSTTGPGCSAPGERVRLRIINASAQTTFNVRIPGLPMTVVQADGLNVRPGDGRRVPDRRRRNLRRRSSRRGDRAYSFVSEAIDRSGLGRATLAPREGMAAPVPPLRPRPLLTMKDMGGMGGMDHAGMDRAWMGRDAPNAAAGPRRRSDRRAECLAATCGS